MLKDLSLEEYVTEVESERPTPGGGSVAALVGSLGAALSRMLANLSVQKTKFKEASKDKQELFATAFHDLKQYEDALIDGIDGDALSYQCVISACKIKDEEEIQRALHTAAFIALDIVRNANLALEAAYNLIELANKNVISDLLAGTILLQSCVEISYLNVVANVKLLKDEKNKKDLLEEANTYLNESRNKKAFIVEKLSLS